jgi:hypothetical protein
MATAQAYYDLDAILADQQARTHAHAPTRAACVRGAAVCVYSPHTHTQKLPCTFDVDCPNVGFLIHGDNSPDVRTLDAAAVHSACTRALCVLMRGRVCLCVCVCVCVGWGGGASDCGGEQGRATPVARRAVSDAVCARTCSAALRGRGCAYACGTRAYSPSTGCIGRS